MGRASGKLQRRDCVWLCRYQDWPPQHHEEWLVEFTRAVAEELIRDVPNMADIAYAGSFGGFVSDGQRFDLQEMEDGRIRPSAEAMKALEEQFGNTLPQQDANSSRISEEERRLQEAMRMLKEAVE